VGEVLWTIGDRTQDLPYFTLS